MSTLTLLVLFVQGCLVQNAFSRCIGPAMAPGLPVPRYTSAMIPAYAPAFTPGFAGPAAFAPISNAAGAYGGEGIGDVAIAGRMPVAGTTAIAGQVPILGSVRFGGDVAARGTVTITGSSGYRGRYC